MHLKSELQPHALTALTALAQTTRLQAFRILAASGEAGVGAGALAKTLNVPHNTLSTHLAILQRAGLITSTREGRNVTYYIVPESLGSMLSFLLQDCCAAVPQKCLPKHLHAIESAPSVS